MQLWLTPPVHARCLYMLYDVDKACKASCFEIGYNKTIIGLVIQHMLP